MKNTILGFLYDRITQNKAARLKNAVETESSPEIGAKLTAFINDIQKLRDKVAAEEGAVVFMSSAGAPTTLSKEILLNAYDELLAEYAKHNHGNLHNIAPGSGRYFKRAGDMVRAFNSPKRSYAITHDADGFRLYLEPKTKFFSNLKRIVNWPGGSYKRCKLAYRIDKWPFIPCASMVTKVDHTDAVKAADKLKGYQAEIAMNNNMRKVSPFFGDISSFTEERTDKLSKKQQTYVHSYTEHVEFDLLRLIQSGALNPLVTKNRAIRDPAVAALDLNRTPLAIPFGGRIITTCQLDIMWQISQAVAAMHAAGIVHRDIKAENLLFGYDPVTKRLRLRVIDLGFGRQFNYTPNWNGTPVYTPPEIFASMMVAHIPKYGESATKSHQLQTRRPNVIGESWATFDFALNNGNSARQIAANAEINATTGQHDIWSLGILFFEIIMGTVPVWPDINSHITHILMTNRLLYTPIAAMLEPDPQVRCDIGEVVQELEKYMSPELKTVPDITGDVDALVSKPLPTEVAALLDAVGDYCANPTAATAGIIVALTLFNTSSSVMDRVDMTVIISKLTVDLIDISKKKRLKEIATYYTKQLEALHRVTDARLTAKPPLPFSAEETARIHLKEMVFTLGVGLAKLRKKRPKSSAYNNLVDTLKINVLQPALAISERTTKDFQNRFAGNSTR